MKLLRSKHLVTSKLALSLIAGLLALPAPMHAETAPLAQAGNVHLRLMETTDIHMNLVNYDYYTMQQTDTFGLAKTASLIKQKRAEAQNSMLFDNGDLIQGSPLGDYVARVNPLPEGAVHPAYKAMNLLDYDAATLGNHEFNYGLAFLENNLKGANFPYVSANVFKDDHDNDPTNDQPYIEPWKIIDKEVVDEAGHKHILKVGVIGFVPPQIMQWDNSHLSGKVIAKDIVDSARIYVDQMKAAGADIIVALAHTGGGDKTDYKPGSENAGYALAGVAGIDAILLGHTHTTMKESNYNGVAMVQAGGWGDHLGVIDLKLTKDGSGRWVVLDDQTAANAYSIFTRQNGAVIPNVDADQDILDAVAVEHDGTVQYVQQTVGTTSAQIFSYFAQVQDDPSIQIVTHAQKWYAEQKLQGTDWQGLPILSAGAPFKLNTNIPAGAISIKDTASLYQFPNTVSMVKMSGEQVKEWLEMSAGQFNQIDPNRADEQPLINASFPSFNFDVIDGVTYQIDVTQPARYNTDGNVANAAASRIKQLQWNGQPIDMNQDFVVVTNNYRAGGGGNFPGIHNNPGLEKLNFPDENRQALVDFIKSQGTINPTADRNWTFTPIDASVNVTFTASAEGKNLIGANSMLQYVSETSSPGTAKYAIKLSGTSPRDEVSQARISLEGHKKVHAGKKFDLHVNLAESNKVDAASVTLKFDPQLLQVLDANPHIAGIQVKHGTSAEGANVKYEVDNAAGTNKAYGHKPGRPAPERREGSDG
ncbi:bifunctional 2',3'-cyclic-nucleotide 2'-phosphodiesterase/3'-nucleotidase [Paenibacillus xerothermodurans]|uniref:Bifunctional 2',3'-cyclic-nucleotide 2'-phosphodiesterase/3'-nucleotidase n=1 Tax=Paenibacillus xerothermodurans TaxID=1977292 RepID=A0A2W1NA76_PAEXE|nr:bifunctional 2',3'-cyclic-nucleotide 2'-phosphodiesterase/3'-nucleotidase [Paenibacillus xerothermodurans]PZE21559.1 bifunctional 2',3'-cyclic-nucleotide 2'-phosphodiesterase/3'-nucleotidase [Paenibacillus xerothermodurans]